MNKILYFFLSAIFALYSCDSKKIQKNKEETLRQPVDTIGFPTKISQIEYFIEKTGFSDTNTVTWKCAISPHDDYAYVQDLYPAIISGVKAKHIILIGVAHKARLLGLQDKIVFGSFDYWKEPYGNVKVSPLRDTIIAKLDTNLYVVNDSMMAIEHSLEAFIPLIQYFNKKFDIIPILVPYMKYETMEEISENLSDAIYDIAKKNNWQWGKDFMILISTDAVHYGDKDWGGKNFANYGTDTAGYLKAKQHELEIIDSCLRGNINPEKIKKFTVYTVKKDDYKEYKWTWCGRYSVPFGLFVAYNLQNKFSTKLNDCFVGYSTSIEKPVLDLSEVDMGTTAIANLHHWVGYCAIGYY